MDFLCLYHDFYRYVFYREPHSNLSFKLSNFRFPLGNSVVAYKTSVLCLDSSFLCISLFGAIRIPVGKIAKKTI